MKKSIGIIGFGNMGSAIAGQIKDDYTVYCYDVEGSKTTTLGPVTALGSILDLVDKAEVVILSVKPQDFDQVLSGIKDAKHLADKLFISIAAGISTRYIEDRLGIARVVRVMPNLAIRIGQGFSCLCKGRYASSDDFDFAEDLFEYMGEILEIKEEMMDAATAISGSGPAYIFYDMESRKIDPHNIDPQIKNEYTERLTKAALAVGFDPETALELATGTTVSSVGLAVSHSATPGELKAKVASRGGTTEAALKILAEGGSWENAALAAKKRAQELSKKE